MFRFGGVSVDLSPALSPSHMTLGKLLSNQSLLLSLPQGCCEHNAR